MALARSTEDATHGAKKSLVAPPRTSAFNRAAPLAVFCLALSLITFLAMGGVLSNGFVNYDDDHYVTDNPRVQSGLTPPSVAWAFTTTDCANWHPVTWLSYMLDVQIFGVNAGKFHLVNLLMHMGNVILLFLLLVVMTDAPWPSAFAACLFAVHPLHVESVAWISERKDVLSTLFWLLALAAWLWFLRGRSLRRYVVVLALFTLGLMAKPMLVTLPFTLLLLDFWPLGRLKLPLRENRAALKGLLLEKAPLFGVSVVFCFVTVFAQGTQGAVVSLERAPLNERIASAALAYVAYLGKTFWPTSLSAFYPYPHVDLMAWPVCGAAILLSIITASAFWLARPAPYLTAGWLWYVGTLVPVIGLVQVGSQAMADRYTYVPLVGIFMALAWGLADLGKRSRPALLGVSAAAAASLVLLVPITRSQVGYWTDSSTLWKHALAVNANSSLAHNNMGMALFNQGEGQLEAAVAQYREALRISPNFDGAWINLGSALAKLNRLPEAIDCLQRAVQLNPALPAAQLTLGICLDQANRTPEGLAHAQEAVRLKPDFVKAWSFLGRTLGKTGRMDTAIECFQRALALAPESAEAHYDLGVALALKGASSEAAAQFREALRLKPGYAEAQANLQALQPEWPH